jgi:hypothetical protein
MLGNGVNPDALCRECAGQERVVVRAGGAWSAFGGAITGEDLLSRRKMQQPNAACRNHRI